MKKQLYYATFACALLCGTTSQALEAKSVARGPKYLQSVGRHLYENQEKFAKMPQGEALQNSLRIQELTEALIETQEALGVTEDPARSAKAMQLFKLHVNMASRTAQNTHTPQINRLAQRRTASRHRRA